MRPEDIAFVGVGDVTKADQYDGLDAGVAPSTGNVTMGGLASGELLDVFDRLRTLPIEVLDVAEVSPRHDPTGRTPQMAARVLFELLFRDYAKEPS